MSPTPSDFNITDSRGVTIGENNSIYQYFAGDQYSSLAHKLISFADLIADRTDGFVGRQFVVDAIDAFLATHRSGYFIIEGEPGVGKTSLLAHLVSTRRYPHHFVSSALGVNRAEHFLENICAQLIARHRLDRPSHLPPEASRDGAFLFALLGQVGREVDERPIVLVVDALDEVADLTHPRQNVLCLPPQLPDGVYVVLTTRFREHTDLRLHVETREFFQLSSRSTANLNDVRRYLEIFADRSAMRARLTGLGLPTRRFVDTLLGKAEGNFMYLHHVLPAIERGMLGSDGLGELPQGLQAYYETHWRQLRGADTESWFSYRQPVIVYLAAAREPVTVGQIAAWSHLPTGRVRDAVREWREFLHTEQLGGELRYRIYHTSFQDFLHDKDEAREIDFKDVHQRIASSLMTSLFPTSDSTP